MNGDKKYSRFALVREMMQTPDIICRFTLKNVAEVVLIDPFRSELEKIKQTLVDGVGLKVFALCDEDTIFPTLKVPPSASCEAREGGELANYVYLAAGWNILIGTGVLLGLNLDKPQRARKVGNEFIG